MQTKAFLSHVCRPEEDFLYSLAVVLAQIFGKIVRTIVKTLSTCNTNLSASRHIQRQKVSLPVDLPPHRRPLGSVRHAFLSRPRGGEMNA